jgi:hypothetical protein
MLNLLQALFYNRDFDWQDEAIFHDLLNDAQFDQIAPQLYILLKKKHRFDQVPYFFQQALKRVSLQALLQNMLLKADMKNVLDRFESLGVEAIPFKGPYFSEAYYGDLAARRSRDLDILVRPEEIDKAIAIIQALGYLHEQKGEPEHFHRIFYRINPKTNVVSIIELHWHFLRSGTSNLNMELIWNAAVPIPHYNYVHTLSDFHMFYVICLHAWNHELNGWKHFIDVAQMILVLQDSLNYHDLFVFAKQQKTYRRVARTLIIVYHEFPGLNEILPLPLNETQTFWWSPKEIGGRVGLKETLPMLIKRLKQLSDYDNAKQRLVFLKRELLPDPVIMNQVTGTDHSRMPRVIQYMYLYFKRIEYLFLKRNK